jgi:hypothetical protein
MKIVKFFLLFLLIFISQESLVNASNTKIKVFYSGFSLTNIYESNEIHSKYTSIFLKEAKSKKKIENIFLHFLFNLIN